MDWKKLVIGIVIAIVALPALTILLGLLFSVSSGVFSTASSLPNSIGMDSYERGGYAPASQDFAPELEERKIAKSSTLVTEVERGSFAAADEELHRIVDAAEGFILTENVREVRETRRGDYQVKVPADRYDEVVVQLRGIAEVTSFSEHARDVTGQYVNNDVELAVERERLTRLEALYNQRSSLSDKLKLEERIHSQERKIRYLEESLERLDQQTVYSSVRVTLQEEESPLRVSFVGFSDLWKTFVGSLKALLYVVAALLPWAVVGGLLTWLIVWLLRRRR